MPSTAQLVMLGFDQPSLNDDFRHRLAEHDLGGVFLYGDALGPAEQVQALTAEIQSHARELPLFIAVDQDGGRVQEWGPPHHEPLPSAAQVGFDYDQSGELIEVTVLAMEVGTRLAEVGINLDFAPVLDVNTNPDNPIIGDRSFGGQPERVVELGCAFIEGLHASGVLACGKHFPGHGDTALDSHTALPVVNHGTEHLWAVELLPFGAAISRGLQTIMTAHVVYPAWDPERAATISPTILEGVLRQELGFGGLIFTDDLKMQGLRDRHDLIDASLLALDAGCDVLLSATEHDRQDLLLDALAKEHRDGRLPEDRVRQSLERIATVKRDWLLGR